MHLSTPSYYYLYLLTFLSAFFLACLSLTSSSPVYSQPLPLVHLLLVLISLPGAPLLSSPAPLLPISHIFAHHSIPSTCLPSPLSLIPSPPFLLYLSYYRCPTPLPYLPVPSIPSCLYIFLTPHFLPLPHLCLCLVLHCAESL